MYEDGLMMRNGFFRTRHFNRNGSEAGSIDLFADDHHSDGEGGIGAGGEQMELNSQAEAKRRKDRLEREEFIRKFRVCLILFEQNLHIMQTLWAVYRRSCFPTTTCKTFKQMGL